MTDQQAAWVRANAWPAWMLAMDDDYPERGCFLFHMCHCEIGLCVACSENEPRHDLCLTRQHGGKPLGWDMGVWAWTKGRQAVNGRKVADVTVAGRSCRWVCPCGCWRKPLPEPKVAEPGPLTSDDIRRVIADAYTPWQASLVLGGHEQWGVEHMRPTSGGSAGLRSDGVFAVREDSPRGMCVHLVGYDGTRATWERVGVIGWGAAERLIRGAATPATTKTLLRAVARERKLIAAGQHDQAVPVGLAAQRAWAAIIQAAGAPVQGELFGAPA